MDIFSNLKEYELLELQEDLKTIFMIKKNNYIRDLDNEEIEEIKYYKSLFKKISNELENIDLETAVYANAKLGIALNDCVVACWYSKYFYDIQKASL